MTKFELIYIIPAKVEEAEKKAVIEQVNQLVTTVGGNITDHNNWMTRKLSYPINHIRQGVFMLAHLELPNDAMDKLRKELEINENIIRYLITKVDTRKSKVNIKPARLLPQSPVHPEPKEPLVKEEVSKEELDKRLEELLSDKPNIK